MLFLNSRLRSVLTVAVFFLVVSPLAAQIPANYYDSATGLTGDALKNALHEIIDDHVRFPYTSSSTDTWDIISDADEDPNNLANVLVIYKNESYPELDHSLWNREHSWPKSYGFGDDGSCNYPYTDVHHLFASNISYNAARGNLPFADCDSGCNSEPVTGIADANYWSGSGSSGSWEPWDGVKGDLARAMFYMATRYQGGTHGVTGCSEPDLVLTNNRNLIQTGTSSVAYMGLLDTLLAWHAADPVDASEQMRNDVIYSYQGNRNPFVDHPEYVTEIWTAGTEPGGGDPGGGDPGGGNPGSNSPDLFFSEYVEGGSNNKALEIYNGSGAEADLSQYTVELYSNGSTTLGNTLTLSDALPTLADGAVLVIGNASADSAILNVSDITSSVTFFNGDDAIVLKKNDVIIDVIGVVGSDPGSAWGTGDVSTQNRTIRRLATVCAGDVDGFDNPTDLSDQWEGFAQDTFDGLGSHVADCTPPAGSQDLFFSEYVEGAGNNKALEIYNGTGADADLSQYVVELYSNGSATPGNTLTLSDAAATLAHGGVLVIGNPSADAAIINVSDITSTVTYFNGDDAVVLKHNGVIIDMIGVVGSDPGSEWGSGDISTGENTIRRLSTVCDGDANGFDNPGDISDQWTGYPQNTFDDLGFHTTDCAPVSGGADNLFFSEYIEGSSNNKALEIFNGTGSDADLSEYVVELYSNGATTPGNTLTLSDAAATLADGDVLVIANASADAAILNVADITSSVTFFNGDDAIVLKHLDVVIDVIGVVGSDPGSEWGSGDASTQNNTIRRLTCTGGDADGFDNPSDISDQWAGFPSDTFDDLGSNVTCTGGGVNLPVVIDCGSDISLDAGTGGTTTVSASDGDGTIASIVVTQVTPAPSTGSISAGSLSGDAVIVTVSSDVPAGSYSVLMTASNTDATPQTATCSFAVTVNAPATGWVINEFLADPAGDLTGDANGDGTRDASEDEFVEIVNLTGSGQDISNWTISDAVGERHTFPAGTVIDQGSAIVVFGGGTPTGSFGDATVQVASSGLLGLNNGGDTIIFANNVSAVMAQLTYGSEGGGDQSLTLDPDLSGSAYVQHSTATGSGGTLFSPGTYTDGSPFGGVFAADLFFSEYVEGSSSNKAIEIFNGTGSAVDLSQYVVELYSNGSTSPGNSLTLSDAKASLLNGETLVIANASAVADILNVADITSSVTFFNGDDALVLKRNGTIVDMFGVVGADPGSEWGTGDISTQNNTIRRLAAICSGDPDGFGNAGDISDQWEGFPSDTFDGLGSHSVLCVAGGEVAVDCGDDVSATEGTQVVKTVLAADPDGVIASITVTSVTPTPASGSIAAGAFTPGNPAALDIIVSSSVPAGSYVVEVEAANTDVPAQTGSCQFTVNVAGMATIAQIQGATDVSPYANLIVTTPGNIVTAITSTGFFMQTPDNQTDGNPNTSEGLFVYTGSAPTVAIGDEVTVSGNLVEYFNLTEFSGGVTVTVTSSGNPLPAPVLLDENAPSTTPLAVHDLERFEGMLVMAVDAIATGPTDRFGDTPLTTQAIRALREPGILYPGQTGLPVWDGNPEVFQLDADGAGLPALNVFGGSLVDAVGPLTYTFGAYKMMPTQVSVEQAEMPRAVRAKEAGEFSIGSQNLLRLFLDQPDPQGYLDRLAKFSSLIRDVLGAPDVLAVSEVENLAVLEDLADQIALDDPSLTYTAYVIEGNDIGGIDVGFLVQPTVQVNAVTQIQPSLMFDWNGGQTPLHDRPPLLLDGVYVGGAAPLPISLIAIHNRSLNNIEDASDGGRVRQKRLEQAENIAQFIQDLQVNDPDINLALMGDFNAFEFTDGYVDSMGILTGDLDPLGALLPGTDYLEPNLVNQVLGLDPSERYSYNFGGNGQTLDHLLTNENLQALVSGVEFGRANSDAPASFSSDPTTPLRSSDHDGIVAFISPEPPATEGIVDNLDAGFSATGEWTPSTVVSGYWADNYQFNEAGSGADSASWSFDIPASGQYRIYARWTAHENRATNATYTVGHDGADRHVVVDQTRNGGKWYRLGTFNFTGGVSYDVSLSDNANGYVIADAIRWERHEPEPPTVDQVIIDNGDAGFEANGSWPLSTVVSGYYPEDYQYNDAGVGLESAAWNFQVLQSDVYAVYARWTSHPNRASNAAYVIGHDGGLDTVVVDQRYNGGDFKLLGTYAFTSGADYAVTLDDNADGFVIADAIQLVRLQPVAGEVVVDNGDSGFLNYGEWKESTKIAGYLGSNYQYITSRNGNDSAVWSTPISAAGSYEVYARWTSHPNRPANAPYLVEANGVQTLVTVNQKKNGGEWVLLGTFSYSAGETARVILSNDAPGHVIADGVRWLPVP